MTAFALLSALLPSVGALFACEALGVSLCVLVLRFWVWPLWLQRHAGGISPLAHSREAANVGLLPALIGSFGFAPLAPFAAGYLLRPCDAAATTLFAACVLALTLLGLPGGIYFLIPITVAASFLLITIIQFVLASCLRRR